jgi:two-component system, NarL family, response regulator DevR
MEIFLVEDSSLVRARLAALLDAVPGASVVGEADRADSAIRGILALRPDLVLLDINLAAGSGFDVLRAVCREAPEIDFYMLSNFAAEPYRELAERLGARDFFDKSKEIERVRELIAQRAAVQP